MVRTDQRMRNFMKNGIADMGIIGMPYIMPRQRYLSPPVIALASPSPRIIEPYRPVMKTMFTHHHGRGFQSGLQRARRLATPACFGITAPHAPQAT